MSFPNIIPRTPKKERIVYIPTLLVRETDEKLWKTCAVCQELMREKDIVAMLSCEHVYHHKCVVEWLKKNVTCPQCRQEDVFTKISLPDSDLF